MCGLLSIHVLLVPFLGLRSAALARGRRLESAPYLLGLSLAPLAVGALAFALDARAVVASIEPWSGSGSWFGRNAGPIVASRLAALAPITWFASIVAASASAVVATGGLARLIAPLSRTVKEVDDDLTLTGLRILYERNV